VSCASSIPIQYSYNILLPHTGGFSKDEQAREGIVQAG
jgi:hypothetical protein